MTELKDSSLVQAKLPLTIDKDSQPRPEHRSNIITVKPEEDSSVKIYSAPYDSPHRVNWGSIISEVEVAVRDRVIAPVRGVKGKANVISMNVVVTKSPDQPELADTQQQGYLYRLIMTDKDGKEIKRWLDIDLA